MNDFLKFILKRLIAVPVTLFIITLVLYGVVMMMPKEARIDLYMPQSKSVFPGWQDRVREKIIERHHLNDSYPVQYYYWARSLFDGDWGYSPSLDKNVLPELIRRTPVTFELIFYALMVQIPLGLIAGVWSARKKRSPGRLCHPVNRFYRYISSRIHSRAYPPFNFLRCPAMALPGAIKYE